MNFVNDYKLTLFVLFHSSEFVLAVTGELKHVVMVLPKSVSVRASHHRDALGLHVLIEVTLDIDRHCAGALVQDCV